MRRPDARLVMIGRGILDERLRQEVDEHQLAGRVTFEGFTDHETLVHWYNRASLVVVPSHFEGFGLSAAEAQSCGACVVVTDSEGLRDLVEDGVTGAVVAPEIDALADRMAELLAAPDVRARMGAAAAERIRSVNDWPTIADRTVDVYRQALGFIREPRPVPISALEMERDDLAA
jgi:glycosyltransferase involved in cell wall biosynthesis